MEVFTSECALRREASSWRKRNSIRRTRNPSPLHETTPLPKRPVTDGRSYEGVRPSVKLRGPGGRRPSRSSPRRRLPHKPLSSSPTGRDGRFSAFRRSHNAPRFGAIHRTSIPVGSHPPLSWGIDASRPRSGPRGSVVSRTESPSRPQPTPDGALPRAGRAPGQLTRQARTRNHSSKMRGSLWYLFYFPLGDPPGPGAV